MQIQNGRVYQAIAASVEALKNCQKSGNEEWELKWADELDELEGYLPSDSGFDNGTTIDRDATNSTRIVLNTSYHHMDGESGMYDGWTDHVVTVTPTFNGIDIRISGRDKNNFKEYALQMLHDALTQNVIVPTKS